MLRILLPVILDTVLAVLNSFENANPDGKAWKWADKVFSEEVEEKMSRVVALYDTAKDKWEELRAS